MEKKKHERTAEENSESILCHQSRSPALEPCEFDGGDDCLTKCRSLDSSPRNRD